MRRRFSIHLIAGAILILAAAALPTHLRAVSAERLQAQAWLSFCGPTASGLGTIAEIR